MRALSPGGMAQAVLTGAVSAANSLVGSTTGDMVGDGSFWGALE